MEETFEARLLALRLPQVHQKRLRTANLLEQTFGENRRRTKIISHFLTEKAALKLTYAVLLAVSNKARTQDGCFLRHARLKNIEEKFFLPRR